MAAPGIYKERHGASFDPKSSLRSAVRTEDIDREEDIVQTETIAAVATAQGQGGIGVIRVSGPESIEIVEKIFKSETGKKLRDTTGYRARYGKIFDGEEELDEVVVLIFRAPHSYTGENVVEISCHGGLYITKRILRLVFESGARPAEPGEFTRRAFLNGKIDLIKAESVMKLIGATGKNSARAAISVIDGAVSKKIEAVKNELIGLSARLSVWSDYPDDETIDIDFNSIEEILNRTSEQLNFLKKNYDSGKILINGVDTVIIGAPNVGKSTLMNALSGVERSIVTEIPGTTRDIVEEVVTLGGLTLNISDTAGIRKTDDIVEAIGVKRAKDRIKSAELVLFVLDGTKNLEQDEVELINSIKENKVIAIINKCDLKQQLDRVFLAKLVDNVVEISAKDGIGLENLEKSILKVVQADKVEPSEGILVSERQFLTVKRAISSLEEAKNAMNLGLTLDAVTVSINDALDALFELTGEKATQVVVDEIFSKFCVGK